MFFCCCFLADSDENNAWNPYVNGPGSWKWYDPNGKRSHQRIVWRVSSYVNFWRNCCLDLVEFLFIYISFFSASSPQNSVTTPLNKSWCKDEMFFSPKNTSRPSNWMEEESGFPLASLWWVNALRWMVRRTNLKWCGFEVGWLDRLESWSNWEPQNNVDKTTGKFWKMWSFLTNGVSKILVVVVVCCSNYRWSSLFLLLLLLLLLL